MFGCDAKHSGDNGVDMGVPPAVDQWSESVASGYALHPVTVESGRVFATSEGSSNTYKSYWPIVALSVADGSSLWTYNFGDVFSVGHPAVVSGVVYVQTVGSSENSYLWAFDAATGSVKWSSSFSSQWDKFWAPTVAGTKVYIDGGNFGGLYAFNVSDGSQVFFNGAIGQYDSWSPAFFGGDVYSFVAGTLGAFDPMTGTSLWTVVVPWNVSSYSMDTSAVFDAAHAYVISSPSLYAIDPVGQKVVWTATGSYSGTPAVASGVVYAVSAGTLVARDASSGSYLWTFAGDTNLSFPPVVANGYVYVSSGSKVYAVDIATHEEVWSALAGGWLSIASRRLLVAGGDGVLHGFVLSP
jgi:outer membrane protein assembly factor BamB